LLLPAITVGDPFYGFGDHDGLEVFTQAVRIAHLDTPYADWVNSVTLTPANLLGLPHLGRIKTGLRGKFVNFQGAATLASYYRRPQWDRLVIRRRVEHRYDSPRLPRVR
jgi:cytosine deaminase